MSVDSIDIKVLKDLKSLPEGPREHARPPDEFEGKSTEVQFCPRENTPDVRRMHLFRSVGP